ncbi:hypothetical protein ACFLIM_24650 [Nonomuraea sp. M3C6]|uniref:Uncharacterized protein n=1 Tax=Nonomuraea marmarensis TaxID=3351344 RepID=A0ABW7AG97_9ACTN
MVNEVLRQLNSGQGNLDPVLARRLEGQLAALPEYEADDSYDSSYWAGQAVAIVEYAVRAAVASEQEEAVDGLMSVTCDLLSEVDIRVDPDVEDMEADEGPVVRAELQAQQQAAAILKSEDQPSEQLVERLLSLSEPNVTALRTKLPRWIAIEAGDGRHDLPNARR